MSTLLFHAKDSAYPESLLELLNSKLRSITEDLKSPGHISVDIEDDSLSIGCDVGVLPPHIENQMYEEISNFMQAPEKYKGLTIH